MPIDDRTAHLNLPLPHEDNLLRQDVARVREALNSLDTAVFAKAEAAALADKADLVDGKIPAIQLPSYVDDVLEFANLAAFPATGESGKIYIALDNNRTYRWGGSAYIVITASPGSTDAVPEGATNLYFTAQRARDAQNVATGSTLGVVKVGSGLIVGGDGTLSATGGGGGGSGLPAFSELAITPASNGQTVFAPAGGYTAGQIEVYLNGVLLYGNGDDYTASNGTTITLTTGVNTTDTLLLRRWAYLPAENAVNKTGDTMTGFLAVPAGATGNQAPRANEVPKLAALPVVLVNANTTAVAGNHYVITAAVTLTLPTGPAANDAIEITNASGLTTPIVAFGGVKLRGATPGNMTLDSANARFRIQYSGNATYGWA